MNFYIDQTPIATSGDRDPRYLAACMMFAIAATTVCMTGCSSSVAENDKQPAHDPATSPIETTNVSADADTMTPGMDNVTLTIDEVEDDVDETITDELNFFQSPQQAPRPVATVDDNKEHGEVRLLGFINLNPVDPEGNKALLKIGDAIVPATPGETVEGVTLVNIEGRSVTLQRDRDRWSLAMFEQPIINKAVATPVARSARSQGSQSRRSEQPADIWLPEGPSPHEDSWMPPEPQMPEMPKIDIPEPIIPDVELPQFDEELPGLKGLPGLE